MSFVETPPTPYSSRLYGGQVSDGMMISLTAVPNPDARSFAVNLQTGPATEPRDDIAIHISPQFMGDASKVVRNSLHRGQWGEEESFGHFPFAPGRPFELLILVDEQSFSIAIDGEHYAEFNHRMPMGAVTTLVIDGDVEIIAIRTEGGQAGVLPIDAYDEPERQELMCVQSSAPGYASANPSSGGGGGIGFNVGGGEEEVYTQQVVSGAEGWFSRNKSPVKPPPQAGEKDSHGIPNWVKYTAGGVAAVGVAAIGAYALKKLVYPSKKGGKEKGHSMKGAMGNALADKFLSGQRGGGGGPMTHISDNKKAKKQKKKDKSGKKEKKDKKKDKKKKKKHNKHSSSSSSSSSDSD